MPLWRCAARRTLRKLERLLNALVERDKEWFYLPYLALLITTQLCWAIEDWKTQYVASLSSWLDAWAEFEALNALACYASENPENVYPQPVPEATLFEGYDLGHPLIPAPSCVTNGIALNADSSFYVVSGSNMAGKSTLLRAVGLNAVLAFAGTPVRVSSLRISELSICASFSIVDSLCNGKSRFMAEMDRLRISLETAIKAQYCS